MNECERKFRMQLLGDVVFNAAHYQWQAVLKFHAAVLAEIECSRMNWGDSYYRMEQQMLMPYPLMKGKSEGAKGKLKDSQRGRSDGESRTVFCADYQKGSCRHSETHQGNFFGKTTTLHHICGTCFKQEGKKMSHPSSAPECPSVDI